jgi:hypothetical protein
MADLTRCARSRNGAPCGYALVNGACPICTLLTQDVTPGQFISPAHYGAWMRGCPIRADRTRWRVPTRWREIVLRHHSYKCEQCGTKNDVQVEHIVPVAFGGSNQPVNLTVLCGRDNRARWTPEFRELLAQAGAA